MLGLAKKKATIMRHFSIKLLTGPIQNGGRKGGVVLDSVYRNVTLETPFQKS